VRKNQLQKLTLLAMLGCLLVIAATFLLDLPKSSTSGLEQQFNPSGDFSLTEVSGKVFHLSDYRGKVVLLFFGYTTCPDACPSTLAKLSRVLKLLGPDRTKVQTVFVTVDPLQDTPDRLKEYLAFFGVDALGLTGTKEQIDEVVKAYHAYYQRVPTESALGYAISHTVTVYLIGRQGKVHHLFSQEDSVEKMAEVIKRFL
jgi:protein SCO1/2